MKVLVTYLSQSGNTKKIARAIRDRAGRDHEADLIPLADLEPGGAAAYDVIFLGSPLHSGALAAPVKEWLEDFTAAAGQKMAGFITHFAPGYPEQDMAGFTAPIRAACKEKGLEYLGAFDCQGALAESLHAAVRKKLGQTDAQWAETVRQMTGHPDQADEENAKVFAAKVLA